MINEFSIMVNKYEIRIPQINGIQLFILSLWLTAYTLMGLKTAQGGEIHYRQAVSERSKKMKKLTRHMQSLEKAVSQIDLYSR